jgi:putative aminopeptidase FrvX
VASLSENILQITRNVLKNPTAPFREHQIRDFIIDFCNTRSIRVKQDAVGNLIATYGTQYKNTVFAFGAHMDHPGFIIEKDSVRNHTTAWFYGGVEQKYFKGSCVKIFTQNSPVKGTVTKTEFDKVLRRRKCWLRLENSVQKGDLGMWDLPPVRIRGDRLYSRACDDLVGCVSILTLLDQLHRRRIHKKVQAIFTVAEEAGFQGAKYLCKTKQIPKNTNIIAIETSSVLPTAKMGDGVVIRVGDRSSIFTPGLTAFLLDAAKRVQSKDKSFKYQRKLMDGGSCESTIYNQFGYTNAAVCIPLGNYHNRNFKTEKIAAEFVSLSDLENMVKLFLAIVKNVGDAEKQLKPQPPKYKTKTGKLDEFFYW